MDTAQQLAALMLDGEMTMQQLQFCSVKGSHDKATCSWMRGDLWTYANSCTPEFFMGEFADALAEAKRFLAEGVA